MFSNRLNEPGAMFRTVAAFGGINPGFRQGEGELKDANGFTSEYYPALVTRNKTAAFSASGVRLHGLFSKEKLSYINNGLLYYGGVAITGMSFPDSVNGTNVLGKRQFVSMGAYLLIFPDKKYLNTNDLSDYGDIGASFSTSSGTAVSYTLCDSEGMPFDNFTVASSAPASPSDGDMWLDTGSTPHALRLYSEYSESWAAQASTYVKIASPGIGGNFSQYDGVKISGSSNNYFNTTFVLWAVSADYVVVTGIIDSTFTQTEPLTLTREVPDMDYFAEGENRVWGCSSENNEVYACKLGDFKNWNCFMGLSTDSYAVSVGTDGDFTGAVRYMSNILFFKENRIHKIYGTNPPYTVSTSYCSGVQKGSHASLCIASGDLYYMSPTGVCRYSGGCPLPVSDSIFKNERFSNAVAGEYRNNYHICVTNGSGSRSLFVYDTARGIWQKHSNTAITEMASNNSNLFYIASVGGGNRLFLLDGEHPYGTFTGTLTGFTTESVVEWELDTGDMGLELSGSRYISLITLRAFIGEGTTLSIYSVYDDSAQGELIYSLEASPSQMKKTVIPLSIPRRSGSVRFVFEGSGEFRLYSLTCKYEEGSEL